MDQYQRKEASYKELVRCLRGFYEGEQDADKLKLEFLNQLNQSWLYCPDEVIRRGYDFLDTVNDRSIQAHEVKSGAMGEFLASIRRDLLTRDLLKQTSLTALDFRHLGVK